MAKKERNKDNDYVDNVAFMAAMVEWKAAIREAEDAGDPKPQITEYIGECFVLIAERLSRRANFINYKYRDDMIGDAIENCVQYAANFDTDNYKNPFAYFTQIVYFAFLRRIEKEKKQTYIKYKMALHLDETGEMSRILNPAALLKNPVAKHFDISENDIDKFTPKKEKKKLDAEKKKKKGKGSDENTLF